jgi:hypothetical protein
MKAIDDALFALFSADNEAEVGLASLVGAEIYREGSVPDGAAFPRIQFGPMPGVDAYTLKVRTHTKTTFAIKAVDGDREGNPKGFSTEAVNAIAKRVDYLLTDKPLALEEGTCIYLRRIGPIEYTEMDGDERYQHVGGNFQVMVTP